jgi:hypothetical protein
VREKTPRALLLLTDSRPPRHHLSLSPADAEAAGAVERALKGLCGELEPEGGKRHIKLASGGGHPDS